MGRGVTKVGPPVLACTVISETEISNRGQKDIYSLQNKTIALKKLKKTRLGLSQLQVHYQTMCLQADRLHCLIIILGLQFQTEG